jgi:hypothetical protein
VIVPSRRATTRALLAAAIALALAGVAAFLWVFARDFNIYWLILSPVIITLYELPAVYVFHLYRRRRAAAKMAQAGTAGGRDGSRDQT